MMRLNLGSGSHPKQGWMNVDAYPPADVVHNLENSSWPIIDNSIDEVMFHHSLEHMGQTPEKFFFIVCELYRVCKPNAIVNIVVPHPAHDDFLNDPTHVRPITPNILQLFSKKQNEAWKVDGSPNTPLALQLGVDFEIVESTAYMDERFKDLEKNIVEQAAMAYRNVIKMYSITLKVIK